MLYEVLRGIARAYYALVHPIRVTGKENLPAEGGYILAANHTSFRDPIALCCALDRRVSFMAKKELFRLKPVSAFLKALGAFPVDRGAGDIAALRGAVQILKSGEILGIFPEGHRFKKGEERTVHTGTALIMTRAKVPAVIARIDTDYKPFRRVNVTISKLVYTPPEGAKASEQITECTALISKALGV